MNKIIKKIKKNYLYIIAFLSLLLFFFILREYFSHELDKFDSMVYNYFSIYQCPFVTSIFKFISHLCGPITIVTLLFLLLVFGKNKEYDLYAAIITAGAFILNYIVKIICQRPRPIDINLIHESGFSLPSSHAMVSVTFYGFLMYYIYKLEMAKRQKILLEVMLGCIIATIGISRVYLGVHYASDVLAGMLLSIAYYIMFIKLIYNKRKIKIKTK